MNETMSIPDHLPAEFQDQIVQICCELSLGGYIRLLLDYPGRLDPGRMSLALRRLLDAEPVLACRFTVESGRAFWRRREDLDAIARCMLIDTDDLEDTTQTLLAERFDPAESPNAGAVLIRPRQSGDRLLLRISHVVADGTASLDFATALTDLYSRLASDADYRLPPNTASRDSFLWLRNFPINARLAMFWEDIKAIPGRLMDCRGLLSDHQTFLADARSLQPFYHCLCLDDQRVAAINTYAHNCKAGFNDVCLAAFFRAFDEFCPTPANGILATVMPTNLRRFAPLQRRPALRNLAGTTQVRIGREAGADFEETLTLVRSETRRHQHRGLGTEGQMLSAWMNRLSYAAKQNLLRRQILGSLGRPAPPVLTQVGHMRGERLACDGIKPAGLVVFGEASPLPVFLTSVVRLDKQLAIGICGDRRLGEARIAAFLKRLDRSLPGFDQQS